MKLHRIFGPPGRRSVCRKHIGGNFKKVKYAGRKVVDLIYKGWELQIYETVRIIFGV